MPNPENLRPARTTEEAKERGKKGGVASGVVRRRKRDLKNAARALLELPITFGSVKDSMKKMGIDEEDMTNQMAILVSMFKEAMSGNVRAAEFIRETTGDGAEGLERSERLRLDRERFEMEKERFKLEQEEKNASGEGMPIIVNVRPKD